MFSESSVYNFSIRKYCGNRLDDGDRFCGACGHPVDEKPVQEAAPEKVYKKQEDEAPKIRKRNPEPEYDNRMTAGMGYGYRVDEDSDSEDDDEDDYQPGRFRDDDFDRYQDMGSESDFAEAGYTMKETSDDDDLSASDYEDDGDSGEDDFFGGEDD